MHRNILVTGGAGFAGTALCIGLARAFPSATVTALDNLHRRGSELNLDRLRHSGVAFFHGDVRNLSDLLAVSPAPDLIIECSAEPSAQAGYGCSADYLVDTNLNGCFHCLELARRTRADFIFISTSRVYPFTALNDLPFQEEQTRFVFDPAVAVTGVSSLGINEEFRLEGPRSLYGMTKLAAELMVEEFADAYGFRYVIDRFGLITGPHQMAKSDQGVIALWMAAHFYGRNLSYIGFGGAGKQVRDFLHVDDFCDLVVDQVQNIDLYKGQRYNVGGGVSNSLSLVETTALCQEITGQKIEIGSIAENRPADVRIYVTDSRRVSSINGWHPRCDAHKTLTDIHEWLRKSGETLRPLLCG